jgi:hypothetical protein
MHAENRHAVGTGCRLDPPRLQQSHDDQHGGGIPSVPSIAPAAATLIAPAARRGTGIVCAVESALTGRPSREVRGEEGIAEREC